MIVVSNVPLPMEVYQVSLAVISIAIYFSIKLQMHKSRHVRTLSVGLVWSSRRRSPRVRVAESDTDQTLSEIRSLVGSASGIWTLAVLFGRH